MRRPIFIVALILVLSLVAIVPDRSGSVACAVEPVLLPASKTGWWIKVKTDRTEATSIDFQIGTKREDRETWRTWRSSDAAEFDLPDKYLKVARVYIQATANPQGKHAWFCLMYQDHGVKHYDLDDREEESRSQTDSDGDCNSP